MRRKNDALNRSEEKASGKLKREVARLKEELNLARNTRLRDWFDPPIPISKHDWRAIQICLHPDGHPTEKQRTKAFQVFNGLKINVTEP